MFTTMKKSVAILLVLFASVTMAGHAQVLSQEELPSVLRSVFHHKEHFVDENGDTLLRLVFNPIIVYPAERFKNAKEREEYYKLVRDVKKTLPYAKLINNTLQETYEYIQTFDTHKEREDYLRQFEKTVFKQYKPEMKKLTRNQGKVLIKLIHRETNQSSYYIIKAFMGTFRAGFWQTFGRFFGVNMRNGYDPDHNKHDALIERITVRVEQGQI